MCSVITIDHLCTANGRRPDIHLPVAEVFLAVRGITSISDTMCGPIRGFRQPRSSSHPPTLVRPILNCRGGRVYVVSPIPPQPGSDVGWMVDCSGARAVIGFPRKTRGTIIERKLPSLAATYWARRTASGLHGSSMNETTYGEHINIPLRRRGEDSGTFESMSACVPGSLRARTYRRTQGV